MAVIDQLSEDKVQVEQYIQENTTEDLNVVGEEIDTANKTEDESSELLSRLHTDISFSSEISEDNPQQSEQELALIRQLLQAEASADACDLLEAQDNFLESTIASDSQEELQETSKRAKEMRKSIIETNSNFKAPTAAPLFGEETFSNDIVNSPKTNSEQKLSKVPPEHATLPKLSEEDLSEIRIPLTNLTEEERAKELTSNSNMVRLESDEEENTLYVKIDQTNGLNQDLIDLLFGTFEESEFISKMMSQINTNAYQLFFDRDPKLEDDFKFWCTACLRAKGFVITSAKILLNSYVNWRHNRAALAELASACHSKTSFSATTSTERNNCPPVEVNDEQSDQSDTDSCSESSEIVEETKSMETMRRELESGAVLFFEEARCKAGRGIIAIRLFLHDSSTFSDSDLLLCLHNVIAHALKTDPKTQAKGFTFILDMTLLPSQQFSMTTVAEIINALLLHFPIRCGKILIYNPPLSFSARYKFLNVFISWRAKEVMKRVFPKRSKKPETMNLFEFIDQDQLPTFYAGSQQVSTLNFSKDVLWTLGWKK